MDCSRLILLQGTIKVQVQDRTTNFLFQRFYNSSISKGRDLENAIENEIEKLKENKFFVGYDSNREFIEFTIDDISELFLSLRRQKIKFYSDILKEYRKNKQNYDNRLDQMFFPSEI